MRKKQTVRTVDRLVAILECFSPKKPTWSLTELSIKLNIPSSSLHRFLITLGSHGILRRDYLDKRWRLGYRLFAWGCLAAESTQLVHIAKPFLQELARLTEETAFLTAYQNHEIICIEKVESEHPVRMTMEVGTRRLPHAGASSKVILAYLPDEEIQDIIREKGLPKLCINTITDPGELSTELAEIRGREYALSQEETDLGAWGVATPILDRNGIAIAGIGVAGPLSRYSEERVEQHVKHCQTASHRIYTLLSTGYDTCAE